MEKDQEWFASWFDSPYYPVLYRHRDFQEAEEFIRKLVSYLQPDENSRFLDLACGRGRHSRFLNALGYQVHGLDLSRESIATARKWESPTLQFDVHDMREPLPGQYDFILNLFTSFGYFDNREENEIALRHIAGALASGGTFVLDFLNREKVLNELVEADEQTIDGILFKIRRSLRDGFIVKDIHIEDEGKSLDFQERVQALARDTLVAMAEKAGLRLSDIWGDYEGGAWHPTNSPRLILFFKS